MGEQVVGEQDSDMEARDTGKRWMIRGKWRTEDESEGSGN